MNGNRRELSEVVHDLQAVALEVAQSQPPDKAAQGYCQSKCAKHDLSASRTESRFAESRNSAILQPCRSTIFDAICG